MLILVFCFIEVACRCFVFRCALPSCVAARCSIVIVVCSSCVVNKPTVGHCGCVHIIGGEQEAEV